jgi:hypothetical protein
MEMLSPTWIHYIRGAHKERHKKDSSAMMTLLMKKSVRRIACARTATQIPLHLS